jgi:hypothetical protein
MASFARINKNTNKVEQVIAVSNNDCGGGDFPQSEPIGQHFINDILKLEGRWLQTSYNSNFRKRFAGIEGSYDPDRDVFLPPKRFNSWLLDEKTLDWIPPVPYPDDGKYYTWNEEKVRWDEVIVEEPKEIVEE